MILELGQRAHRYTRCIPRLSPTPRRTLLAICGLALAAATAAAQRSDMPASPREVRELGRLERPDMVPLILPLLSSDLPAIRTEAANALAQSLWPLIHSAPANGDSAIVQRVGRALRSRLAMEREPAVVASIAGSLGRLPYISTNERRASEVVLAGLLARTSDRRAAAGAARGIESLLRNAGRDYASSAHDRDVLRSVVRGSRARWRAPTFAWPRRLALMALTSVGAVDTATLRGAMSAADPQLRRLAALAARTLTDSAAGRRITRALLDDSSALVRIEAVRSWSRIGAAECAPLVRMMLDGAPQASITVIEAIGTMCAARPGSEAESTLVSLVLAGTSGQATDAGSPSIQQPSVQRGAEDSVIHRLPMHRAAHAMVALARVSPARARALLGGLAGSPAWQARMYAARAAALLSDTVTLATLASDARPNVRTEAIAGLAHVVGHAADGSYMAALSSSDYQLVLTAAQALRGTPRQGAAVNALVDALARITAEKRETSRDPRIAILGTLREIGSPELAGSLMPYVGDFDPAVADSVAAIISRWSGRTYTGSPRPLPEVDGPPGEAAWSSDARVRVTMAAGSGGGSFELRLFADDAPATVSRFVRLVRDGYYDGLTIHRVVPDFVVQGGSPGANEYVGDGPFMRDEVGLRSHTRGAVGISTRGRDTGDAQFFVDLVDNPRLDHDYTVFAELTSGMDVVDQLLEGDVMQSVEIITGR